MFIILLDFLDGIMDHLVELETAQYSSKVWTLVLRGLFEKKLWRALKLMLIGVDGKKGTKLNFVTSLTAFGFHSRQLRLEVIDKV